MLRLRWVAAICCALSIPSLAATFGSVVPLVGGASDLVLDETRGRLYLVNSDQNRVEVYSIAQKKFLNPIPVDALPLGAAISRDGKSLYVTANTAVTLDVVDLDSLAVTRVPLPAQPEGVAVGVDGRVLISTIGSGAGNASNILLVYDPSLAQNNLITVPVTPPAPQLPTLPPPSGRPYLESRSQLRASRDGTVIVGANIVTNAARVVFVFDVASGTVLRSRAVAGVSSVLGVNDNGSRFMAGLTLFEAATLRVIAQQNLANAAYPLAPNTNFNTQTNQGGSVFSPDGTTLYSAFDITPIQNPAARPNVTQLMLSDPENLLINLGLQLPENLAGKMVITADGSTIYALSESGFLIIPISTYAQFPIAVPEVDAVLLANDQCGATAGKSTARVNVLNRGKGRLTASAQLLQYPATGPGGIPGGGGNGNGNGGGIPGGGGFVINVPTNGVAANAPGVRTTQNNGSPYFDFSFSAQAARSLGTISPAHDFLVQSPEAINIPQRVRVYQNNRNAEARGTVIPIPIGISTNEALVDLVYDSKRQRVYIANSGLNRIEIYDVKQQQLLTPIKAGQLPRSLAIAPDGNTMYVVNSGGESVSMIDLDKIAVTGQVQFPPIPFNASSALVTPSLIASGLSGPQLLMNNGSIWKIVGDTALPRPASMVVGTTGGLPAVIGAPRSMAAAPGGEYVLIVAGNTGTVYLYDALQDDFVQARQVLTPPLTGFIGPITVGPKGQYFVVDGTLLNQALTPLAAPVRPGTATAALVQATAPIGNNSFARFTQPTLGTNNLPTAVPTVDIVDTTAGNVMRSMPALEGPLTQLTGNTPRGTIDGRTMAVDAAGTTAYVITASGLSIVPLDPLPNAGRPQVPSGGVVNLGSYQTAIAQNSLISIFGTNLGPTLAATTTPLPTVLGNMCVTLGNTPLPLFATSSGQINAQIPPNAATGNQQLVIRSLDAHQTSANIPVTISKYAPAVLVDPVSNQIALFHSDGSPVTKDNKGRRDEPMVMYAVGLGATTGGTVTAGLGSPAAPLAVTAPVEVFFGNPTWSQAGIIVDFSGLTPGFVGLYQLNLRIPGTHIKGDNLPVTIRIGGVSSPATGPLLPTVSVE